LCIGNQWHTAQFPILSAGRRIAAHKDFASIKVHITPCDLIGFTFSAASECQTPHEVRAIPRTPRASALHSIDYL